jgi:hypothetical protein
MTQLSNAFEGLDAREIEYVKARANANSNSNALKKAHLSQGWLRNRDADDLFKRAMTFKADTVYRAQMILEEAVEEAAMVKASGLKVRDERIKQAVATEILDRKFGKPSQQTELTAKGGAPLSITVKLVDDHE